jgi:anti-sigma B factor antagonist
MIPRWKLAGLAMGLEINTRELNRVTIVDAVGRLTLRDARTQLRDLIHVLCSNGHKKFLLNLAGVDYIDSDGMGELVRCYSVVRQRGGEMKLTQLSQRVANLLELTRLNTLFDIYGEEQIALRAFQDDNLQSRRDHG